MTNTGDLGDWKVHGYCQFSRNNKKKLLVYQNKYNHL